MAIFRCKMCGGDLEIQTGDSVCTCGYCGTEQTLPRLDTEKKENLYNRANHFRRNNDFDKAMGIYEQILNEDNTDAEAYWSLVLCRYGIEYVEDPVSHKRIPTVNRTQYTSIYADEDYKAAIKYAATAQKIVYEQEARAIDEIQKGILEISNKEAPFDVFICYKETDDAGRRTPDSVLANDLYHQLTQEGFKVFFSRITLEDKLGQEYEPYIFAALNSAKVMVVLGTKPEYFQAVWVRNEWSRYLSLIRKGEKKMLVPAYKDMDPYDLPEEFSHLQAQDMSKLGFMQDLIRGIKKIIGNEEDRNTTNVEMPAMQQQTVIQANNNVTALLQRGEISLEDGEWEKADEFFEEVLNQDAHCAEAYLGKFLEKYKKKSIKNFVESYTTDVGTIEPEMLEACPEETNIIEKAVSQKSIKNHLSEEKIRQLYEFDRHYASTVSAYEKLKEWKLNALFNEKLFTRAQQYASGETKQKIDQMILDITEKFDSKILTAKRESYENLRAVKSKYEAHLKDADNKIDELRERFYQERLAEMKCINSVYQYERTIELLSRMNGYKDTKNLINQCQKKIASLKEEENHKKERLKEIKEKEKVRQKKIMIITFLLACIVISIVIIYLWISIKIPYDKYFAAMALKESGKYEEAIAAFKELDNYNDSKYQITVCQSAKKHDMACELEESGELEDAYSLFLEILEFENAERVFYKIKNQKYEKARKLEKMGELESAYEIYYALGDYEDSKECVERIAKEIE